MAKTKLGMEYTDYRTGWTDDGARYTLTLPVFGDFEFAVVMGGRQFREFFGRSFAMLHTEQEAELCQARFGGIIARRVAS